MTEVPDYSRFAGAYAGGRPHYPAALFEWLASEVRGREAAWDSATGSGQAAIGLAAHFDRVIASDVSAAQLSHAPGHPRIEYRVARAEASGLEEASIDLVVAAAAAHWFDLERFFAEARRVLRPGGVLALWTYHVAHISPPLEGILGPFYRGVVAPYFSAGARLVDARYETIALPGEALQAPSFTVTARWRAADVLRYVTTWSGVQAYITATGKDPVAEIAGAVREAFGGEDAVHEVAWPLYLRAARLG